MKTKKSQTSVLRFHGDAFSRKICFESNHFWRIFYLNFAFLRYYVIQIGALGLLLTRVLPPIDELNLFF